jgi:hypothetical protein
MVGSYPYQGSPARQYNTGWTAAMTNKWSPQTESFQTWAMCHYAS